jgi:hypothetical protein
MITKVSWCVLSPNIIPRDLCYKTLRIRNVRKMDTLLSKFSVFVIVSTLVGFGTNSLGLLQNPYITNP